MALNTNTQTMPVATRNKVNECSRRTSMTADGNLPFGCLLSAESFSYRCLVNTTVNNTPVQSAIAFPKNEPMWVDGSDRQQSAIHKIRTPNTARRSECLLRICCGVRFRCIEVLYKRPEDDSDGKPLRVAVSPRAAVAAGV